MQITIHASYLLRSRSARNCSQKEYKKGTLPETKLKEVDSQKEVKANGGKEVVYCRANSTFYLPKSELTDEQLLQIIDFNERRDYALAKQNQADRARAAQSPVDETANKLTEDQAIGGCQAVCQQNIWN